MCFRNAINVVKSFSPAIPSTTAVRVERASAIRVPLKRGRSQSGDGVWHLCGSVTLASTTGGFQLV